MTMAQTDPDRLALRFESGRFVVLPPPGGAYVLGRSASCNVVLDDNDASSQHCRIEVVEDGVRVVDLGSTNGTLLNGAKITESMAKLGDVVVIGASVAKLVVANPSTTIPAEKGDSPGKGIPPLRMVTIGMGVMVALLLGVYGISQLMGGPSEDPAITENIEKGKAAYERGDWDAAIASFTIVPDGHDQQELAQRYIDNARVEKANEKSLRSLELYLESDEPEYALQELIAISEGSVYEQPGLEELRRYKDKVCDPMLPVLAQRASDGNEELADVYAASLETIGCGDATTLMRTAMQHGGGGQASEDTETSTDEDAAASQTSGSTGSSGSRRSSSSRRGAVPAEAKDLLQQGSDALLSGGNVVSIEMLREARRLCAEAKVKPSHKTMQEIDRNLATAYARNGLEAIAEDNLRRARLDLTHAYNFDGSNSDARSGLMDLKSRCNEAYQSGYVYETGHHLLDRARKYYQQAIDTCPDVAGFGLEKRQQAQERLANMEG